MIHQSDEEKYVSSRKRNILVTGGAGFIGSHTVDLLLAQGYGVTVLDDLSTGYLHNLQHGRPNLKFIHGSILDSKCRIEAITGCYAVIHLAAISSVAACTENTLLGHRVNVEGTISLLEEAGKAGVSRFIFASSAAVYGDPDLPAIPETRSAMPISTYGIDKLSAEKYIDVLGKAYGVGTTAFRFFNVYGPRQPSDSPYSGVIGIFLRKILAGLPVTIFGDGQQTRDYVFVSDVAALLAEAIDQDALNGGIFNVGTGHGTTLLGLVDAIQSIVSAKAVVMYTQPRFGDIRCSIADNSKLRMAIGWLPKTPIDLGLTKLVTAIKAKH